MTARDRTVLFVVATVAAVAAFWFVVLSPQREEASALGAKIAEAEGRVEVARQGAVAAEAARSQYDTDYATVARLGKAVPADDDVPSLVFQLEKAAAAAGVDFRAIRLEAGAGSAPVVVAPPAQNAAAVGAAEQNGGTAPAAPAVTPTEAIAAALPPGAAIGPAGFPTMPFSFTFNGSFLKLEGFLDRVKDFASIEGETIRVRGRLLTVDAVSLTPGPKGFPQMTAKISATAYLQPPTSAAPVGAAPVLGAPTPVTPTTPAATTPGGAG